MFSHQAASPSPRRTCSLFSTMMNSDIFARVFCQCVQYVQRVSCCGSLWSGGPAGSDGCVQTWIWKRSVTPYLVCSILKFCVETLLRVLDPPRQFSTFPKATFLLDFGPIGLENVREIISIEKPMSPLPALGTPRCLCLQWKLNIHPL
ncbi:hypothetical protein E4T56_gene13123 [Termitomyces sp. T112]|nr:hypothetical protein E4T56_gene13123 [Termitomyces sp. T112]